MTGTAHPLVTDYLATIEREASFLPPGRREELLADLREHLAVAVGDEEDPQAVRTALERLGSPSAIVAAARAEEPEAPAAAVAAPQPQPRTRTIVTAVLLGVSSLAVFADPLIGMAAIIAGLGLLWTSDAWDRATKGLATALTLAPLVVIALSFFLLAARLGIVELLVILALGVTLPATAAVRLLRTQPKTV